MAFVIRSRTWRRAATIVAAGLVLAGLFGCALLRNFPTPPGALPSNTPLSTASLAATSIIGVNPTDNPLLQPSAPPLPTTPPDPGATPLPISTQPGVPAVLPTANLPPTSPPPTTGLPLIQPLDTATPVFSSQPVGQCCTLRVRNRSRHSLWIGTSLPYGGNRIKPMWYIEFYRTQPGSLRVYWCEFTPISEELYDCLHRDIQVPEGTTEIGVN